MADYKLTFADGAFNASDVSGITKTWQGYTRNVKKMNETVKPLDRYDDFATMKVSVSQYRADSEDSKYGIAYDVNIHGQRGSVVAPHQYNAAHAFLQKLRGFGLLADVVGSGKTFEACTVLSELAARGAITSMLVIVPRQVLSEWVKVLENKFGLGEGVLYRYPDLNKKDANGKHVNVKLPKWDDLMFEKDGVYRPKRPIIVAMEDFLVWDNAMNDVLYDVVVVDEAHHLCDRNDDDYSGSMMRLSKLMAVKRKFNKPYCLLLSATPHSGDLEKMFRLWYFIRCKGGDPNDFKDTAVGGDDAGRHSAKYERELACYRNEICRGAKTVFDFINKAKIGEMAAENSPYREKLIAFHNEHFPAENDGKPAPDFSSMTETQKVDVINAFLEDNHDIQEIVNKNVANAYHNGVMRSIMIRNPKSAGARLGAHRKNACNVFFFPTSKTSGVIDISSAGRGSEKLAVDMSKLGNLDGNFLLLDGSAANFNEYARDSRGHQIVSARKGDIYNELFKKLGIDSHHEEIFSTGSTKRLGAYRFYYNQLLKLPGEIDTIFAPIPTVNFESIFAAKMDYLKKILREHDDSRVLVFFDYELRGKDKVADRVEEELSKIPEFKSRLLCATKVNKISINKEFDQKEGAILLAKDSSVTEGTNLQASNIVVNFQVTPDPVAMEQRIGRVFRMGQRNDVTIYSLADMTALEGYVLMYFARIGLLASNSGDATIIAGSNNNNMVTVRCKICENAMLLSREEYDLLKARDDLAIYCDKTPRCRDQFTSPNGTLMTEISTVDFQCSNPECATLFERSSQGYECMSADKQVMCSAPESRNIYCDKMCAIAHCRRFMPGGEFEDCGALKLYRQRGANVDPNELKMACQLCRNKCPARCRYADGKTDPETSVTKCHGCPDATCYPSPGVLRFNEKWETTCPVCEGGKLRPVVARTFPAYVRSLWEFKFDDRAFCNSLLKEAMRVSGIGEVLDLDEQYDD